MKKKFLTLFLTLFVSFSSINFSFANPLLSLSPQIIATIGTLAVSSGIVLGSNDDIYDIARIVYEDIKQQNEDIEKIFLASVSLATNGVLTVGGEFLDIIKNCFDTKFTKNDKLDLNYSGIGYTGLSLYNYYYISDTSYSNYSFLPRFHKIDVSSSSYGVKQFLKDNFYAITDSSSRVSFYLNDIRIGGNSYPSSSTECVVWESYNGPTHSLQYAFDVGYSSGKFYTSSFIISDKYYTSSVVSFPSQPGYTWDNIDSNKDENGNIGIYLPGNLDSLVGGSVGNSIYDGVYNPGYDVSTDGSVSIPQVSNPSISIGDNLTIPSDTVVDTPIDPPVDLPDVNDPPIGGIIPSFPSFGDSLDFSPMYLTNINEKFPFSLPWDIGRLIEKFDVEPKAPIFKVPIVTSDIELDLTIFDEWANIVRFFILIGFALSLILISTKLLG